MTHLWSKIPTVLKSILVASAIAVALLSAAASIAKTPVFGLQTLITGGFSVALLGVYVVWVSIAMAQAESEFQKNPDSDAASSANIKIQLASLLRLILLASILVLCILVFKFDVIAAILGVSGVYIPLFIVPFFYKSDKSNNKNSNSENPSEHSEVKIS